MSSGDIESNHSWPVGGATGDLASLAHHLNMCWLGRLVLFMYSTVISNWLLCCSSVCRSRIGSWPSVNRSEAVL